MSFGIISQALIRIEMNIDSPKQGFVLLERVFVRVY